MVISIINKNASEERKIGESMKSKLAITNLCLFFLPCININ